MSARNYLSARDRCMKLNDCLPTINQQKFFRTGQELPPLSANKSNLFNRNLNYSYGIENYDCNLDRAGTPFSDFFSESETGTPDFRSEESDSSSGSALQRNTAEATRKLVEEWERIERTLYDEEGEKTIRPHMIEECNQWKELHPQLRVFGKALTLPEKRQCYRQIEHEEVIAMHYNDYDQFSESEERLSESSQDVTPQNSPRVSILEIEPKLSREKVSFYQIEDNEQELPESFYSFLQITPMQIRSPSIRKRNPSILKSDMASSRWMRGSRPDSSVNGERNSAKSFVSLDNKSYLQSTSDANKIACGRILTARYRDFTRLEPLYTPELQFNEATKYTNVPQHFNIRKVSLPPLLLEEEKKKVSSAKKQLRSRRSGTRISYQMDRGKNNK